MDDKAQIEVDLLAQRLEDYYFNLLKENNFRIFGFPCKGVKKDIDSPEKKALKNLFAMFKTKSEIRKTDIVSENFILKNIRQQYIKDLYFNAYFCIDRNIYIENESYLKDIEEGFKEIIDLALKVKEENKNIKYEDRFKRQRLVLIRD